MSTHAQSPGDPDATSSLPAWQQARRDKIVAAAASLLEEASYDKIQIRDVAAAGGVALGTLYRYFSSKDHLYAEVLAAWAEPVAGASPRPHPSTEALLRSKMHLILAAFSKHPQFFRLQAALRSSTDPVVAQLLRDLGDTIHHAILDDLTGFETPTGRDYAVMLWSVLNAAAAAMVYEGRDKQEAVRLVDRFVDLLSPQLGELDRSRAADSAVD